MLVVIMFGESGWMKILAKEGWLMNRLAKRLINVTTNLNSFSLANCWWFAKFAKISSNQTFPPYTPPSVYHYQLAVHVAVSFSPKVWPLLISPCKYNIIHCILLHGRNLTILLAGLTTGSNFPRFKALKIMKYYKPFVS